MTAADTSHPASAALLAQTPDAQLAVGLMVGFAMTTCLINLAEGLKAGRRRLLGVAGLAAALGITIGVGHAPGGLAAMFLMSLLPGGALLLLASPLRLETRLSQLQRLLPALAGVTWLLAALGVLMLDRLPAAPAWAQTVLVLAVPPVVIAAQRAMREGDASARWQLATAAGLGTTAIAPFFGPISFDITALAMAAIVLSLHLGIRAGLDAEGAQRHAIETHDLLNHQAALLHDEHARVFAFIAHELRSPLGVLLMGLSNLRRTMPDAESAARIGRVNNAAQRMSALIDRHACLLSLARSDFEPALSELSPEQPALEALHAQQQANPDRVFEHTYPDHAFRQVPIDAELVTLALSNLLENAVKHASGNAPIRLEVEAGAESVRYRVINDGPPLPAALGDQSYEIRLPMKDTNGTRSGFGIGLALASRVARVHGGHLAGQSEDGRTTFTLTLPIRPQHFARTED